MNSPFLVQFKKERIEDSLSNSLTLEYDSELDYNIFKQKAENISLIMTKTQIKAEQPDEELLELNNEQLQKLYLETKSITEVKTEQPDEMDEIQYHNLLATQTTTKVNNENPDSDY